MRPAIRYGYTWRVLSKKSVTHRHAFCSNIMPFRYKFINLLRLLGIAICPLSCSESLSLLLVKNIIHQFFICFVYQREVLLYV